MGFAVGSDELSEVDMLSVLFFVVYSNVSVHLLLLQDVAQSNSAADKTAQTVFFVFLSEKQRDQ